MHVTHRGSSSFTHLTKVKKSSHCNIGNNIFFFSICLSVPTRVTGGSTNKLLKGPKASHVTFSITTTSLDVKVTQSGSDYLNIILFCFHSAMCLYKNTNVKWFLRKLTFNKFQIYPTSIPNCSAILLVKISMSFLFIGDHQFHSLRVI